MKSYLKAVQTATYYLGRDHMMTLSLKKVHTDATNKIRNVFIRNITRSQTQGAGIKAQTQNISKLLNTTRTSARVNNISQLTRKLRGTTAKSFE